VRATDVSGAFVEDQFNLTVVNANQVPTITGTNTGSITKDIDPDADGLLEVSGALIISDPDAGESAFQAATVVGAYGTLTIDAAGQWRYAADNGQATLQQLMSGEQLSEVVTVTTVDGTPHNVTITIYGAGVGSSNTPPTGGGTDPGPDTGDDPVEPEPDPEPEPEDIPPVEDPLPPPEEAVLPSPRTRGGETITPVRWFPSGYFDPTISMTARDDLLQANDVTAPAEFSVLKYLRKELASRLNVRFSPAGLAFFSTEEMVLELDRIQQQIDDHLALKIDQTEMIVGAATGLGASVFVGYVVWVFRGGSLLLGALSAMPMWRCFDPLPVIIGSKKKKEREEDRERGLNESEDDAHVKDLLDSGSTLNSPQDPSRRKF
jgi:VCBS repeat-containing protein